MVRYQLSWRKYKMDYDKVGEELEKRLSEMTIEQKRSSLEAPFWNENAEYDKNTQFMKKVNKLWRKVDKARKKREQKSIATKRI